MHTRPDQAVRRSIPRAAPTRVTKKILPGQAGAKQLQAQYGDTLVCVRYRDDRARGRRYTTVELVVAERPIPEPTLDLVTVRIGYGETELRKKAKAAGGRWDPELRLWRIDRKAAKALGLTERIVA